MNVRKITISLVCGLCLVGITAGAQETIDSLNVLLREQNAFLFQMHSSFVQNVKFWLTVLAILIGGSVAAGLHWFHKALEQVKKEAENEIFRRVAKEVGGQVDSVGRVVSNEFGVGETRIYHLPIQSRLFGRAIDLLNERGFKSVEQVKSVQDVTRKNSVLLIDLGSRNKEDDEDEEKTTRLRAQILELEEKKRLNIIPIFFTGGNHVGKLRDLDKRLEYFGIANTVLTLVSICVDSAQLLHSHISKRGEGLG